MQQTYGDDASSYAQPMDEFAYDSQMVGFAPAYTAPNTQVCVGPISRLTLFALFIFMALLLIRFMPCPPYEGMFGGKQDYHAGCTPHHAYRGSHDYNLVNYKPAHLINMYPPSNVDSQVSESHVSESMVGGAQDYHAGCTPHYAYRGSHDYNLVDYKPAHLINMYPSAHRYVNDI
jgi:hypothetical protein